MINSLSQVRAGRYPTKPEGSYWFRRLRKECEHISPYIRFKRIKFGFYRIYFRQAYLHEVDKDMTILGYDYDDEDPRFENKQYYEEYEDRGELSRKIKNYKEGYLDSIQRIKTRVYMMKNDSEFYDRSRNAFKEMRIY